MLIDDSRKVGRYTPLLYKHVELTQALLQTLDSILYLLF